MNEETLVASAPVAPSAEALARAEKFFAEHHIEFVLAQFVDIHGVAKTKAVPVSHFKDILTTGAGFAGGGVWGLGIKPHEAEYLLVGDIDTLTLTSWTPGYARVVGTGMCGGQVHPLDSRNVLRAQTERLAKRGWTFNAGLEPEFFLFQRHPDGTFGPLDSTDTLAKAAYDYRGMSRVRTFLQRLTRTLQDADIDVYQIDHEDANGQYEINFKYADALRAADQVLLFKMAAAEIANELGGLCSFMPKPRSDLTGSGMHIHCSMADASGRNLFEDKSDPNGMDLSPLAYHFLGGVLAHAKALTALLAPSVNSYKRLVVGRTSSGATWAPVFVAYGDNNRTAMVRIPGGRLEIRVGDSGMNPYLALAAVIAAGLDGIQRELQPGKPHNVNFYDWTPEQVRDARIEVLPQNLNDAIQALDADPLFRQALGSGIVDEFIALKRLEWIDYHRHVSEWEVKRYLSFF